MFWRHLRRNYPTFCYTIPVLFISSKIKKTTSNINYLVLVESGLPSENRDKYPIIYIIFQVSYNTGKTRCNGQKLGCF